MKEPSEALQALTQALVRYEDGDVMQLAQWVGLLQTVVGQVPEPQRATAEDLVTLVKTALRQGAPEGFLETLSRGLDALSLGPVAPDNLWEAHGAMFVSDARNRLARAQELILALENGGNPEAVGELFRIAHTIKGEAGFLHQPELAASAHGLEALLDELRSGSRPVDAGVVDQLLAGVDALAAGLVAPGQKSDAPTVAKVRTAKAQEVLRIPAVKIDSLISLVGELLVALESEAGEPSPTVKKLSRGLRQSALELRTEPVRDLLHRIKRGARDLAKDLGKPVEVSLAGEELELDRNLIASLEEPLMHLVRNSLDHGLEAPQARQKSGKPATGRLAIEARHKGNRIQITLSDDGRGLDTDKIWAKALERGLVTGERPDARTIHALIFHPGFSTAETLTQVSGRGVGMDIVSSVVEAARGKVEVKTEAGKGTSVLLSFPLSTAVLEGLVVRLDQRRFLLPVTSTIESLRIDPKSLSTVAQGTRVLSLRGVALPVISLREALDGHEDSVPAWGVVVETSEGSRHILLVDEVESKKEVVIRSLGPWFRNLKGVSAATILAGGALALVVDVDQLILHLGAAL